MENFTEQEDRWLRDALQGVSLPAAVRERIRHRLRQEVAAQATHAERSMAKIESLASTTAGSAAVLDDVKIELASPSSLRATRSSTRRIWLGWALALSITALAFGVFQWSQPISVEQLARHSLRQLDQVLSDEADWHTKIDEQFPELAILKGQLHGNVQPLGYQDRSGGPIAERCRVWKLLSTTTNKPLYVFDFPDARHVGKLTSQLQVIKRVSGGWSMVAMRSGERVVVVLFEGAIESYLYRPQSA